MTTISPPTTTWNACAPAVLDPSSTLQLCPTTLIEPFTRPHGQHVAVQALPDLWNDIVGNAGCAAVFAVMASCVGPGDGNRSRGGQRCTKRWAVVAKLPDDHTKSRT